MNYLKILFWWKNAIVSIKLIQIGFKKNTRRSIKYKCEKNQTILSIFTEEDEKQLININARNFSPAPIQPIPEIPQDTRRIKTDLNVQSFNPNNVNRNYIYDVILIKIEKSEIIDKSLKNKIIKECQKI